MVRVKFAGRVIHFEHKEADGLFRAFVSTLRHKNFSNHLLFLLIKIKKICAKGM
jgi:hypothetical protein